MGRWVEKGVEVVVGCAFAVRDAREVTEVGLFAFLRLIGSAVGGFRCMMQAVTLACWKLLPRVIMLLMGVKRDKSVAVLRMLLGFLYLTSVDSKFIYICIIQLH
jgi:hypothetical protein